MAVALVATQEVFPVARFGKVEEVRCKAECVYMAKVLRWQSRQAAA